MYWKELFKPTRTKLIIIISIAILITFFIWLSFQTIKCVSIECPADDSCGNWPNIIDKKCCDDCVDFQEFIAELSKAIIIPFLISFVISYLMISVLISIFRLFKE